MCLSRDMHICAHARGVDLELGFWVASCKPSVWILGTALCKSMSTFCRLSSLLFKFKKVFNSTFIFYVYMYGHVTCHSIGRGQRITLWNWILSSTI